MKDETVASLTGIRTLTPPGGVSWSEVCVGVPAATGPTCSADGEGGGEGGKLAESSTAKGETEREKETAGRQDVDGRKDTAMLTGCVHGGSDDRRDSQLHKTWISEALKVYFGMSGGP